MNDAKTGAMAQTGPRSHLEEAGETYFQHMRCALSFAWRMICGGFCVLLHAFVPQVCCKTGSRCIERLHGEMVQHRKEFGQGRLMKFTK